MAAASTRLEMSGIRKSFSGVAVLADVDFSVGRGEVVALLGSNGAGKSTLMKILTGVYNRDAGTVRVDGEEVDFSVPAEAVSAGVKLLPQEISVMPDMTVAENIFLGDLPMRRSLGFPVVDDAAMRARSAALLDQLGFGGIDPDTPVKRLSVAEQRIVEIARALTGSARVLVMDEPTAALTEHEARLIFRIIRRLTEQGVAIVYISHYLAEVFEISDRIVVLRDGRNAGTWATSSASRSDVLAAMLGNAMGELFEGGGSGAGANVLEVGNLTAFGLSDVSLSVNAGEIVGVFGLVGSGVETLGRALYGVLGRLPAGLVTLAGKPFQPASPMEAKAAGVGFVAAERKKEGIIGELTVRENVALPFQDRFVSGLFVSRAAETAHATHWIRTLSIRTRGPEQKIRTLSGGNQQKVCLARWLVDGVRLLILEEPTRGVDVGARREIYSRLRELADSGFAVLVLSSDVEEIAGLSDRSLVLDRGHVVGRFDRGTPPATLMAATASRPALDVA
jgi:ribose transport system ATP-binding protein